MLAGFLRVEISILFVALDIEIFIVGDFMSCRWSDFITGQQIASFFVIDSFRCSGDFSPRIMTKYNWIVLLECLQ